MNKTERELFRMVQWVLLASCFYGAALLTTQPQVQTLLWKLGHVTLGVFAGYWADRNLVGRVTQESEGLRVLARAVIAAACVLGLAWGL